MTKPEIFKERLLERLNELDMKPATLAERTGIDKSRISRYLKGAYMPKTDALYLMALALNVNFGWLSGEDVEKNPNAISMGTHELNMEEIQELLQFMNKDEDLLLSLWRQLDLEEQRMAISYIEWLLSKRK